MTRLMFGSFVLLAMIAGGCSFSKTPQLSAGDFYSSSEPRPAARGPNPPERSNIPFTQSPWDQNKTESVRAISPVVQQSVGSVTETPAATSQPSAAPTTQQAIGPSMGTYLTVGGVIAEVNGTPIFADKVLASIDKVLQAKAREMDATRYRAAANDEINNRVRELIRNELEFAAAEHSVDQEEKTLAQLMTTRWRQDQINHSGGSLELAKKKALENDGIEFDELAKEQYRKVMVQIYYQKKVFPQIQVRADDMREYYRENLNKLFTEHDKAQFRLIKISPKNMGSREKALDKAKDLHDRAAAGEDFAKMAGSINHDPLLLKSAGYVAGDGWVQRGAFAITQVETAVWSLQPGEVTDIIEVNGSFYIAKLENRNTGRVKPFEEEDVQAYIDSRLRQQQFATLRGKRQVKLEEDATIRIDPEMMSVALEMAMQKYPQYTRS